MEVLEEVLLVGDGSRCQFDEGQVARCLYWVVLVRKGRAKMPEHQTERSLDWHMKHCEIHKSGRVKPEDFHAAGQTEHMTHSSGHANMAAAHCSHAEGVPEQEESMEVAMWRKDKDMWAAAVRVDMSHM